MKKKSIAYILWCGGFVGLCGLHRLYAGRIGSGLLWLFTAGLLGIGQLIDLLLIPEHIDIANHRYLAFAPAQVVQQQQVVVHAVAPTSAAAVDRYRELERLGDMRDKGYVTHEEFVSMKQQLFGADQAAAVVTATIPSEGLSGYLRRCRIADATFDKVFFAPNIPPNKLAGAVGSLGGRVLPEDIVVLVDDTAFGGAKEGIYITNDAIFVKEVLTPLSCFPFGSIRSIQADRNKLYINGQKIVSLTMPEKLQLNRLFHEISGYIDSTRRTSAVLIAGVVAEEAPLHVVAHTDPPEEWSDDEWFYSREGAPAAGPVSATELRRLTVAGRLSSEDLVWKAGMPAWLPLSSFATMAG